MVTTKNPLHHRYGRQLLSQAGRYLSIFLFMTLFIGFISGYMVADNSMLLAYEESFDTYAIEDGHFRTARPLNEKAIASIEKVGIRLYELPYVDLPEDGGSTLRLYPWREEVNRICVMEGEKGKDSLSLAVDRLWAKNNGKKIGDSLLLDGRSFTITALVAFSDYSALFENNNDMMFDSLRFCVGAISPEAFSSFYGKQAKHCYAYLEVEGGPAEDKEKRERAEALAKKISRLATLEDFVPRYANQAITFTGDDMEGDKAMMLTLLYILIAIMAFVFALTSKNNITKEASIIGTLRATGYERRELLFHYMLLPILVTVLAALSGNILGYSYFKNLCVDLYYGSYSLPTYQTVWNGEAFVITSVFPILLMILINYVVLSRALSFPPIHFLRGDLSRGKRKLSFPLRESRPFLTRFRLRLFMNSLPSFLTLFAGFFFANVLLYFGLMLPVVLRDYREDIEECLPCAYQVLLSVEDERLSPFDRVMARYLMKTETKGAEKYCITALETMEEGFYKKENISVYGILPSSTYFSFSFPREPGTVLVSEEMADKYALTIGDILTLKKPYGEDLYTFTVGGLCHYPASLSLFMPITNFRETFDHASWFFNGYLSDNPIEDLDEALIATVIDGEDMTKLSRQLNVSFGGMIVMVDVFSIVLFIILQYLLLKLIIEKNARSISLLKILGCTTREVASFYLAPITAAVFLCIAGTIPLADVLVRKIFSLLMCTQMTGYLPLSSSPYVWGEMALLGLLCYALVASLEFYHIQKIPMAMALKDVV